MSNYRYEGYGIIRDLKSDIPYHTDDIVDLLEEKDQQIKELEEQNQQLKKENGTLKEKISTQLQNNADNVNFMENQRREIEQLKQEQNQIAIEELEKLKEEMVLNGSNYCEIRQGTSPHNPVDYYAWFNYVMFRKFVDNQIKELKGEKNE